MNPINIIKTFLETYCPSCKKKIMAHAHKCPYCLYDFKSPQHIRKIAWQKKAIRYWFYFCLCIGVLSFASGETAGIAMLTFILLLLMGLIFFEQILKFLNFFK